jgi:hypothetical protein
MCVGSSGLLSQPWRASTVAGSGDGTNGLKCDGVVSIKAVAMEIRAYFRAWRYATMSATC